MHTTLDDQDDLKRHLLAASRGDQIAFNLLYQKTSARLYALALRLLRRRDWADEVMQEAYLRVWHNAGDYVSERGKVIAWMATILRYRAIDRLRREKVRGRFSQPIEDDVEPIDTEYDPLELLSQGVNAERLHFCLGGLRAEQRRSIAAAFFEGYTHEQLSTKMQAPLGTVKSWVRRGLQLLRQCIEQDALQGDDRLRGAP